MLKKNRSAPNTAIIPVLYYPDVPEAVAWLTTALPFTERLRNAQDRRQLLHGNGAIVVTKPGAHADAASSTLQAPGAHSVTLRVTEIDELYHPINSQFIANCRRNCAITKYRGHAAAVIGTILRLALLGGQIFQYRTASFGCTSWR
jgi:hypothetical protein